MQGFPPAVERPGGGALGRRAATVCRIAKVLAASAGAARELPRSAPARGGGRRCEPSRSSLSHLSLSFSALSEPSSHLASPAGRAARPPSSRFFPPPVFLASAQAPELLTRPGVSAFSAAPPSQFASRSLSAAAASPALSARHVLSRLLPAQASQRACFSVFSSLPSVRFATALFPAASGAQVPRQELRQLEQQAELHPTDAGVQQRYFAALNAAGEPLKVVKKFEENAFLKVLADASGGSAAALHGLVVEYLKALCASELIHSRALPDLAKELAPFLGKRDRARGSSGGGFDSRDARSDARERELDAQLRKLHVEQQQLVLDRLQQLSSQLERATRESEARLGAAGAPLAPVGSEAAREQGARRRGAVGWILYLVASALRGSWRALKVGSVGVWSLLLSPVAAVLLIWSFATEALPGLQQAAKKVDGLPEGKSKEWVEGKIVQPDQVKTTFNDVKGCDEVKKEVEEVVAYLKSPGKFTAMGARLPKGILLQGPPGTGKTLLARAIAGEAGVPFIHASGSEFEEMFVGVGASRLRQLFAEARRVSPCILFIDEIDALGGKRTLTENKHHRQTLNQLLTELDGFKPSDGVTLVCATNLLEALDPALTRPGRMDRIIHVPFPSKKERIEILKHYAANMPLAADVDLETLAALTSGMTGADLANLLNFAAIRAATEGKDQVTRAEVDESFDRLMVGNRRTGVVMKEEERRLTAYHESGHALMALYTPDSTPLHKATILFRGSSLGVTWSVDKDDSYSKSERQYLAALDVAMGGKAAEELIYGEGNVTSGCHSDLVRATQIARTMVTDYGMGVEGSKAPMVIGRKEYALVSDERKKLVDDAVQRLLDASYARARKLLEERKDELQRLAEALLEHETLSASEVKLAIAGKLARVKKREARADDGTPRQGSKEGTSEAGADLPQAAPTASAAERSNRKAQPHGETADTVEAPKFAGKGGKSDASDEGAREVMRHVKRSRNIPISVAADQAPGRSQSLEQRPGAGGAPREAPAEAEPEGTPVSASGEGVPSPYAVAASAAAEVSALIASKAQQQRLEAEALARAVEASEKRTKAERKKKTSVDSEEGEQGTAAGDGGR
ncbi:ATP-dependent metallopeptidase HflB subfamily protein [Besnoitia besnoiti]|uniref:ATP-dependent metallopeptidase HflB subfamily protein n=1 Tax=Besnoitia besnoiti TaxID=94643 RepID=A0A2A9MPB4_BESBE|nr:ATP-dependent metallopeptidase HflB subfamily protein [Besnoitia besnoiti]PFH37622.1 ATP-dependent metallopeptidase HflB subfamily protein [Besnoitia besnoiti]